MPSLVDWIGEAVRGRTPCVVGVGNTLLGDDGVGPRVIEHLGGADGRHRIDAGTTPEDWYAHLQRLAPGVVLFVDAARLGGRPGACWLAPVRTLADRVASTHAPSLRLLATLLEARGIDCWLLGIQPGSTEVGAPMSDAVLEAAGRAAAAIAAVIREEAPRA